MISITQPAVDEPVTAQSIVFNTPHLVDTIMRQAARSTVITCLRVNQLFHDAAGAELYHTVRVCGEHKMQGLLLGAEWEERLGPWPSWATPEPIEGFKNRLLTRIRVLSHHEMKAALRKLMRNVHTVRIVLPIPHDEDDILSLDSHGASIHYEHLSRPATHFKLLPLLSPRKVVIRNANGEFIPDLGKQWPNPSIKTLVWILPTNRGQSHEHAPLPGSDDRRFRLRCRVPVVRVVFHDQWEVLGFTATPPASSQESAHPLFSPLEVINFCDGLQKITMPHNFAVYGLETVQFGDSYSDELLQLFETRFRWQSVTADRMRQLVLESLDKPYMSNLPRAAYAELKPADTRYELDDEYHH